jgi:hypothetical protein
MQTSITQVAGYGGSAQSDHGSRVSEWETFKSSKEPFGVHLNNKHEAGNHCYRVTNTTCMRNNLPSCSLEQIPQRKEP